MSDLKVFLQNKSERIAPTTRVDIYHTSNDFVMAEITVLKSNNV